MATIIPQIVNWSVTPQNGQEDYFTKMNIWLSESTNVISSANTSITAMNEKIEDINNIALNAINAITFDNIAQLKLNSNMGRVDVLGYSYVGDGGGGVFYWDPVSIEPDNGGTIIQATGISTGRWKRDITDTINVKWFGATGHGIIDDTIAIKNASLVLESNMTLFFPNGIYTISHLGFSDFSNAFGNSVINLNNKKNINVEGNMSLFKIVNHDISTYGGLLIFNLKDVNGLTIRDMDFDLSFIGSKDSSSFYPVCGAFEIQNELSSSEQNPNDLSGDILIENCKFKIFHPQGSYKRTNNPYEGDNNNGFKIYSITLLGANSGTSFADTNRNITIKDILFKEGHNAYGVWTWATNNVSLTRIVAESWVSKATYANGSIGAGIPFIRYHNFKASNFSITNCIFRAKPSNERTILGFEGSAEFLDCADNLISSSTTEYGTLIFENNILINGHGDNANSIFDYLLEIETAGNIIIGNNSFDGHQALGNRYEPDPSVSAIVNTAIFCNFSKDNSANGVSYVNISNNIFGKYCQMNNILIENTHDTKALRKCKSAIITGNTSYSQYNTFFANSRLTTYSSNGIDNILVSNNIIDGTNSKITSANSYSRALFLVSTESTNNILINNNKCENVNTFCYDTGVNASTFYKSYANRLVGVTTPHLLNFRETMEIGNSLQADNTLRVVGLDSTIEITAQSSLANIIASKILNIGGESSITFQVRANTLNPFTDNNKSLGSSLLRWSVVYAGSGTINTSDDREKTYLDITEVEKEVALELKENMRKFKFNDAIIEKGEDNARIHFGASAQTIERIFKKYNLNPFDYALLCYDEWDEEKDEDGNITREKGDRYGVRYDELLSFIIGAM